MDAADLHLDNNIHDHLLERESFDETVTPTDLGDETLDDDVEIIHNHEPSEPNITRKKRKAAEPYSDSRLKSLVWKSYTRIVDENGIPTAYVNCNRCQRKYKGVPGSGSSQLKRHNDWHKAQDEIEKNKKDGQPTIAQSSSGAITSFKYNPQEARIGFAEMIVQAELPFSFVENPYFTKWIQHYLQPMYRPVTRNTVKADLFKGYEPEKLDLISYFSNFPGKVCLTTDLWRSGQNIEYMCITAHYINVETWEMQKRMLYFQAVDLPITGHDIGVLIQDELLKWGISNKVLAISCDNAKYYDNTFALLGSTFGLSPLHKSIYRVRCCSHVLNLVVQAGLKHMSPLLNNVRHCVRHIRASTKRRSGWKNTCEQMGMPHRALLLETDNRWNTTFHMLTRALKYKKVIMRYMSTYTPEHTLPLTEEWKQLRKFRDFLQPFYLATLVFCQIYQPSTTQVVSQLPYIVQAFEDYSKHVDYDRLYKPMVDDMRAKFDKYWKPLPLLFGIAALFDPRYKQKVLENILKFIYGETDGKIQLTNIMEKTKDLFDVYSSLYGGESHIPSSSTSTSISSQGRFDRLSCLFTPSGPTQSTTTELQRYLDERLEDNSSSSMFDILRYWKLQSERYPILTSMVRDLLSAQVSSVASEQAFSTGKRVISDHRCSLTPESIEVTMCREDWLRARDREQENVSTMKLLMDTYSMTLGDLDEFEENEELGVDD